MILGQLIQTGRHFCECRSKDFVPGSEETIVVIAYSIHDRFLAHSFDIDLPGLIQKINDWLVDNEAIAYVLVHREPQNRQQELPSPVGREPMDRLTITAATANDFSVSSFLLQKTKEPESFRLLETNLRNELIDCANRNLFYEEPDHESDELISFHFETITEHASA